MARQIKISLSDGKKTTTHIFTEAGLKMLQKEKDIAPNITILGECDAFGNVIGDYKQGNFLSEKSNAKK